MAEPGPGNWNVPDNDDDAVSLPAFLTDPFGVLKRRWHLMLITGLLACIATGAATYSIEPMFRATATVLITGQQIPERFVATTVQEDSISAINAMVGQVLSHENLFPLIEDRGLFSDRVSNLSSGDLVRLFRARTDVYPGQPMSRRRRDENALIYAIDYRAEDPQQAADVANALSALFVEASIERRSGQARKATDFLRRQLERDETEQRERAQEAAEFRRANRGELPSELDTNLRRLDLLSNRVQLLDTQTQSKESQILALEALPRNEAPSANQTLRDELRRQLARESAVHTDEHPNVVALRERLERLESTVEAEIAASGASARIQAERRELSFLKSQMRSTQQEIDDLSSRIDRTPAIGEELSMLAQREQVARENYLASLRKVEEAELAESLESAQQGALVTVLDPALRPTSPEQSRSSMLAIGIMLAGVLAVMVAVLAELVDPVIVSSSQLEKLFDGEFIGSVPNTTH